MDAETQVKYTAHEDGTEVYSCGEARVFTHDGFLYHFPLLINDVDCDSLGEMAVYLEQLARCVRAAEDSRYGY